MVLASASTVPDCIMLHSGNTNPAIILPVDHPSSFIPLYLCIGCLPCLECLPVALTNSWDSLRLPNVWSVFTWGKCRKADFLNTRSDFCMMVHGKPMPYLLPSVTSSLVDALGAIWQGDLLVAYSAKPFVQGHIQQEWVLLSHWLLCSPFFGNLFRNQWKIIQIHLTLLRICWSQ